MSKSNFLILLSLFALIALLAIDRPELSNIIPEVHSVESTPRVHSTKLPITIHLEHGVTIDGVLGEVNENIVMMTQPKSYAIELERIVRVERRDVKDTDMNATQQRRVKLLNRLVDHETAGKKQFAERVRTLLDRRDYDALEKMGRDAWRFEERTADGSWLLSNFYYAFRGELDKRDVVGHETRKAQVEEWLAARPTSAYAQTALLRTTIDLAFAHRGTSYYPRVAKHNRKATRQLMDAARALGEQLVLREDLDGEMIHQLINVATRVQPRDDNDKLSVLTLVKRAAALNPDYQHPYFAAVRRTLPRWYGSPAEMMLLLDTIMTSLPPQRQPETYFRIANSILISYGAREYAKFDFDWRAIHTGFAAMTARWPDLDSDRHQYAALAYLHNQKAVVREQLDATHPGWNYIAESVWESPIALAAVRDWAQDTPINHPLPHPTPAAEPTSLLSALRAIVNGDTADLNLYLARGGDPSAVDETGRSLLLHAAEQQQYAAVFALTAAGADVLKSNSQGWQAIHYSARNGSPEVMRILQHRGASLDTQVNNGDTPLHIAARYSNKATFSWLLKNAPKTLNQAGNKGHTPLIKAAYNGHVDMIEALISREGLELDAQTHRGNTALHQAARRGNEDVVRLLLEAGADAGVINNRQQSMLALAHGSGNKSLVDFLESQNLESAVGVSADAIARSRHLLKVAARHYTKYEMTEAANAYQLAINADPTSKTAHIGLAQSLFVNRDYKNALTTMRVAIQLDPSDAEPYYWAGRIAFDQGNSVTAMNYFGRYVKMAPKTYNTKDLLKRWPDLSQRVKG